MQTPLGPGGIRRLLKRLRDLMAGSEPPQARLDQVVRIIAAEMVAEVCSLYVMRPGDVLELFATEGLKPEAVHQTRLRVGEGLVGDIAFHGRSLALADAQSHPNFAYRPETGEEVYHSLMGVPIPRGGRVLGVLAVQNRSYRDYAEEEVEAMETIAMVLAELIAGSDIIGARDEAPQSAPQLPMRIAGVKLAGGMAIGQAVLHDPRVSIRHMLAENTDAELTRLADALARMRERLEDLFAASELAGETREILETFRMFADDRGWVARLTEAVKTGLSAEAAVQKIQQETRIRMGQVADPYIRERLADLDDLANRLLRDLTGAETRAAADLPVDAVLIAHVMGPAELLEYDRARVRAVVLEEGSPTAHVAIVARALGIAMVGRAAGVSGAVDPGDTVIVDGDHALVYLRPGDSARESYRAAMAAAAEREAAYAAMGHLPGETRDGARVELFANAGLLVDLARLDEVGAAGVGLYRTEISFMVRDAYPNVAAQAEIYARARLAAGGRPVIFRTLDVGGDKVLPYGERHADENPAIGWRAIRISLDRPFLMREQLRALIEAHAGLPLHLMFPMIASVAEFHAARGLLDLERDRALRQGQAMPSIIAVGAMLEVPALLWELDALMTVADFVSIGSNDLAQFLYAADRGNPRLSERYDPLAPALLRAIRATVDAAARAGKPLTVCGDMAGDPLEALALIGLGVRRLSMPPAAIPRVKAMIRSVDLNAVSGLVAALCERPDRSLRVALREYARVHEIDL